MSRPMTAPRSSLPAGARVLVTGATGFIGSALVRTLVARGARVTALARPTSDVASLADLPITWVRGDITDADAVRRAVAGAAYAFHLAGTFRDNTASAATHRRVHVGGTQCLARAAAAETSLVRVVHVSTIGVHGHIERPPADETTPFHPGDPYQRTKAEAETWISDFARTEHLPLTVIRPAVVYGPGDRRMLRVFQMAARGWCPLVGRGEGLLHLIHIEDLVEGLMGAAVHPAAQGEVFICGNPAPIALQRMVTIIADCYRTPVRFVRLPAAPLFAAAALCEAVCAPLGAEPPLFRRRVAFFTKDRAFDTTKIRTRLGFAPAWSDEAGLRATAEWYRAHGWLRVRGASETSGATAQRVGAWKSGRETAGMRGRTW